MFEGPRLKIERANHHIEKLNALLTTFSESDFYSFHIEKNAAGQNILKFQQTKPIPKETPLIIGDAVHNLRSALDLVACEIVTIAGGTPSKWTMFPIRETRKEIEDTLYGGEIKVSGADIITLILDGIKPYKGGNDPLCGLHGLDIVDKHRLLIPVASITGLSNVYAKVGGITFTNCAFTVGEDGVLNVVGQPPGDVQIQMEHDPKPVFAVLFVKGQGFEGKAVISTLHQLSQLVSGIVDAFEKAYLGRT